MTPLPALIAAALIVLAAAGPQAAVSDSTSAVAIDSTKAAAVDSAELTVPPAPLTEAPPDSASGTWSNWFGSVNGAAGPIANWIVILSAVVALGAWWWRWHNRDLPTDDECMAIDSFQRARGFAIREDDSGLQNMMQGLQPWRLSSGRLVPEVANELRRISDISDLLANPLYGDKEIDRIKQRRLISRLAKQALRKLKRRVKIPKSPLDGA